jgi:distribution and morphology protein 34
MQEIFPEQNQQREALRGPVPQELRHDPTTQGVSLSNGMDGEEGSSLMTTLASAHEFAQPRPASPHLPEKIKVESSSSSSHLPLPHAMSFTDVAHNSSILEQAWMMKMAGEIARRIRDEKSAPNDGGGFWDRHTREESPPPAYAR